MHWQKWVILIGCLALVSTFFIACEEEEEDEPTVQEWIQRGKELLGENNGTGAYLAFQEALELQSGNLEAKYGVVLADVLQFSDTLDLVLTMFEPAVEDIPSAELTAVCDKLDECGVLDPVNAPYDQCLATGAFGLDEATRDCVIAAPDCDVMMERCDIIYFPPSQDLCAAACEKFKDCGMLGGTHWTVDDCIAACPQIYVTGELECFRTFDDCAYARETCFPFYGETIQTLLGDFWSEVSIEMGNNIAELLAREDDFHFAIDKFQFTFFDLFFRPDLAGVHDATDVYFFASIYAGMESLFNLLLGLDVNFNMLLIEHIDWPWATDIDLADFSMEDVLLILENIDDVAALLELMLNDPVYPTFLTLLEEDGADRINNSGEYLGWVAGNLVEMIERVAEETEDQTDDPIRYIDGNGNGVWDANETFTIPGVVEMDYDLTWAVHDILLALKVDFVDGYPFHFDSIEPLFAYYNLDFINVLLELLDLQGVESIELGEWFRHPDPAGLRPALFDLLELIEQYHDMTGQ